MMSSALLDAAYSTAPYSAAMALEPEIRIEGGLALVDGRLVDTTIHLTPAEHEQIAGLGMEQSSERKLNADGLLVLPGIVDIHGDAFERQLMPRPRVDFPVDIALLESDRQAIANGITTMFHGVTWSWEPGLRSAANARAMLDAIERMRPRLAADTRFHLRHETFNLEAEAEIIGWLQAGRVGLLAFNDHMTMTIEAANSSEKIVRMAERSGLTTTEFEALIDRVRSKRDEVPASVSRLAKEALAAATPLLSHDDTCPDQRRWYRSLGCRLAEFPVNIETATDAIAAGDDIVFGAPNVVRGRSHTGWTNATEMVKRGLCSILASDYYYPAPLLAAFRLAEQNVVPLAQAWDLVSGAPARAVGFDDRGRIAKGCRADLILVDADVRCRPHVVAAITAGRLVHLTQARRLSIRR